MAKSSIQDLDASFAEIEGNVIFNDGFQAVGGVNLLGAKIAGNLDCENGQFITKDGPPRDEPAHALDLRIAQVKGGVYLQNGFIAVGGVALVKAKIDGDFDCTGGRFVNKGEKLALDAAFAEVKGSVILAAYRDDVKGSVYRFRARGGVSIHGAKIGGHLICDGGTFINKGMRSLPRFDGQRFWAHQNDPVSEEHNPSAETSGSNQTFTQNQSNQVLSSARKTGVSSSEILALDGNKAKIEGDIFLTGGFRARGGVSLTYARIEGNFQCSGGQFIGNDKVPALDASGAEVKQHVFLNDKFKTEGQVNLVRAKIEGNLQCSGGQFIGNDKVPALHASGAEVKQDVLLDDNFKAEGQVIS